MKPVKECDFYQSHVIYDMFIVLKLKNRMMVTTTSMFAVSAVR